MGDAKFDGKDPSGLLASCALPSVKSASAVKCWWLLGQECICFFVFVCCCALAGAY